MLCSLRAGRHCTQLLTCLFSGHRKRQDGAGLERLLWTGHGHQRFAVRDSQGRMFGTASRRDTARNEKAVQVLVNAESLTTPAVSRVFLSFFFFLLLNSSTLPRRRTNCVSFYRCCSSVSPNLPARLRSSNSVVAHQTSLRSRSTMMSYSTPLLQGRR